MHITEVPTKTIISKISHLYMLLRYALVVILASLITRKLQQAWANFDLTVEEELGQLSMLCSIEIVIKGQGSCHSYSCSLLNIS